MKNKNTNKFDKEIIDIINKYKPKEGHMIDFYLENNHYKLPYCYKQKDIVKEMLRINPGIEELQGFKVLLNIISFIPENDDNINWLRVRDCPKYYLINIKYLPKSDVNEILKYVENLSDIDKGNFKHFNDLDIVIYTYLVARSNLRKGTIIKNNNPVFYNSISGESIIYVEYNNRSSHPHLEYKDMGFEPIYILPTLSQKWNEWKKTFSYYPLNNYIKQNGHQDHLLFKKTNLKTVKG